MVVVVLGTGVVVVVVVVDRAGPWRYVGRASTRHQSYHRTK